MPIVSAECAANGVRALDRMVETLVSGYEVREPASGKAGVYANVDPSSRELVYVSASAPISVVVVDEHGARTGPISADSLGRVEFGIPDLIYEPSPRARSRERAFRKPPRLGSVRTSSWAPPIRRSRAYRWQQVVEHDGPTTVHISNSTMVERDVTTTNSAM